MKQIIAPVVACSEVMPGVYLIWLEAPEIASIAQPGQFVMVRCGEDVLLRRPLSIHRLDGDKLALLVSVVGKGTHWLSQCQLGDGIDLLGPMGNGFSIQSDSPNLLLVAGGIGTAPFNLLIEEALSSKCSVTLLLGAQTEAQLYPENLLPSGIKLVTATEDGTTGRKGMVTDLIPGFTDGADQVFACGPLPMYKAMAQMPELKDKPVQVSLEVRMGCGRGVCYSCTVKTKNGLEQVCRDGPVFDPNDILWDELNLL